jgi:hypothetical protein
MVQASPHTRRQLLLADIFETVAKHFEKRAAPDLKMQNSKSGVFDLKRVYGDTRPRIFPQRRIQLKGGDGMT